MGHKSNKSGKKFNKHREDGIVELVTQSMGESTELPTNVDQSTEGQIPSEPKLPTQREAVFNEVMRVLKDYGIEYDSSQPVKPLIP